MVNSTAYSNIKDIVESNPPLTIQQKKGSKFHFPIYLTNEMAAKDIEVLDLSVRSLHSLRRVNINSIGDFCDSIHSSNDLKMIRNCGVTSIAEIMDHLFAYQYSILPPERQEKFLLQVLEMNLRKG